MFRVVLGQTPTLLRETIGGNGTTCDLHGRLILARATPPRHPYRARRHHHQPVEHVDGKQLNRPTT